MSRGHRKKRRGLPMILREVEDGKAKAYSFSGMQKSRVQKKSYDNVRFAPILLQKSKIERHQKSRESGLLDIPTAATLCSADAEVCGRFCAK